MNVFVKLYVHINVKSSYKYFFVLFLLSFTKILIIIVLEKCVMKKSVSEVKKRHEIIAELLRERDTLYVSEVARDLGVSELTIRRDFSLLAENSSFVRFHGGIKRADKKNEDIPKYENKELINLGLKQLIARCASEYVQDGDTVFINAGTTTLEVIKILKNKKITIVTNNTSASEVMDENSTALLICTGGEYNPKTNAFSGILATELISKMRSSVCILGVNGISATDGVTTPFYSETILNEVFLERNKGKAIVVADGSKIGKSFCFATSSIEKIDIIITDTTADKGALNDLKKAGVTIIFADKSNI